MLIPLFSTSQRMATGEGWRSTFGRRNERTIPSFQQEKGREEKREEDFLHVAFSIEDHFLAIV